MKRIFCIFMMLILLVPYCVSAEECNKEKIQKIYSLINNINITYTHKGNNIFDIYVYNIPEQLYIVDSMDKPYYSNNAPAVITDVTGGKKYTFRIFSINNNECINNMKYTKSIYVNKYNIYSEKTICQNEKYKDFKYCNKGYQGIITDESFEKELKKFEKEISNEIEIEENDSSSSSNTILIVGVFSVVVVLISLIIYLPIKNKKRRIGL